MTITTVLLPDSLIVSSGINITRIEVWVTNKQGNYNESRNFVGFMDLGENTRLANDYWQPNAAIPVPSNQSNNLLSIIKEQYPGARNINQVTQVLEPLQAFGIRGGQDFEKVESAVFSILPSIHLIPRSATYRSSQRSTPTRCWPWRTSTLIRERYIR